MFVICDCGFYCRVWVEKDVKQSGTLVLECYWHSSVNTVCIEILSPGLLPLTQASIARRVPLQRVVSIHNNHKETTSHGNLVTTSCIPT